MGNLDKKALSQFMDSVLTPQLEKQPEKLNTIEEHFSRFENVMDDLPFIERRNWYLFQQKLKEL